MKEFHFTVTEELDGERIDKCLNMLIDSLSRSYIQKLLASEAITVNAQTVKPSFRVSVDDKIKLVLPPSVTPDIQPEKIPLSILYEDRDVIVIDKPKGMVVHPAPGHYEGTLVNALMYHCGNELSGINGVLRPGIVHRIDRDTTGSIIACKNDYAHNEIARQLKDHTIVRKYQAIIHGILTKEEGTVHTLIGRHPIDRKKMAVIDKGGKDAVTHYRVLKHFQNATYIECILETGRTHQIRVHMAHLGHPLLGDLVYGAKGNPYNLTGQTLHAGILGFKHPVTGKYIETSAPLPEYFVNLLKRLSEK